MSRKHTTVTGLSIVTALHKLEADDRHRGRKARGIIWAMIEQYNPKATPRVRKIDRLRCSIVDGIQSHRKLTSSDMGAVFAVRS